MSSTLIQSNLPFPCRRGKVRDVYDLGDRLLIVSSDRISAFDWILPTPIPDKGRILTQMSLFWFKQLGVENHLLTSQVPEEARAFNTNGELNGRVMVVRKATVVPFECVVRGYLEGSGWRDYVANQSVCGLPLPADQYVPGQAQQSFDKQFVREYLMNTTWDRNSPPPDLPAEIVQRTRAKYVEAFERLSGQTFQ